MIYSKIEDLRNIFLENNQKAKAGKEVIDCYLKKGKDLKFLLRHHDERTISEKETWLRDDVDYFLEYFSILALAHTVGYISIKELEHAKGEILHYLNIDAVRRYYYINYPLLLPQLLLEVLQNDKPFQTAHEILSYDEVAFFQFHALNQTVDNDDVNQFLWFLDNGETNNYDIDDFKEALGDIRKCFRLQSQNNALSQSIRGFFMYLDFLQQFDTFLTQRHKLIRSAYWIYHSYWLTKIDKQLRAAINKFFKGMEEFVEKEHNALKDSNYKLIATYRQRYLSMLDSLIYNNDYENLFFNELQQWRLELGILPKP